VSACQKATRKYPEGRTGTEAGYEAHRRAKEPACESCRKATAARRNHGVRTAEERAQWRKEALERDPLMDRRGNLKAKFGLTLEDYDRMLAGQGGGCAICGTAKPGGRHDTFFQVDHDHACCPGKKSCGKCVRALLCAKCNLGLGAFDDDPDRMMAAVAYLLSRRDLLSELAGGADARS
jgi:hypothetical protein